MESSSSAPPHLIPFTRSVMELLTIWPVLRLSFEQSGTHQTAGAQDAARSELATELVGAFLDAQPTDVPEGSTTEPMTPDQEDIEDFLVSWTFGTLDVRIEDESEIAISRDLISLWKEWSRMTCLEDEETVRSQGVVIQHIEQLAARQKTAGSRIIAQVLDEGHISDDDESEDEDSMQIDKPSTQSIQTPRHNSPTIDEEGFTLVTRTSKQR